MPKTTTNYRLIDKISTKMIIFRNVSLIYFFVVTDKKESENVLNNDLLAISKWAFDWKILFNLDPKKPAQELLFSRKKQV